MTAIRLDRLSKVYPPGVRAADCVSLEVRSGELLVLFGPSGSGKTTLLRLIAGLETPTSGEILFDGCPVSALPPHLRGVGMVFQRPVLFPHLDIRENFRFGLPSSAWPRIEETAALLHLEDLLHRKPAQLSGGEQQRVALGRALVHRPGVLLLDEPLASLDRPLRCELRQQLHLLQRHFRATMIYVTHEQDEALGLADRIAVLDSGRCVQVGSPLELYTQPSSAFVARLVGRL